MKCSIDQMFFKMSSNRIIKRSTYYTFDEVSLMNCNYFGVGNVFRNGVVNKIKKKDNIKIHGASQLYLPVVYLIQGFVTSLSYLIGDINLWQSSRGDRYAPA